MSSALCTCPAAAQAGPPPGAVAVTISPPLARDLPEPVDPIPLDGTKALYSYPAILSLIEPALPIAGAVVANNPERCCPAATRLRFEKPRLGVIFWGGRTKTPLTGPRDATFPDGLELCLHKYGGAGFANETVTATIVGLDQ